MAEENVRYITPTHTNVLGPNETAAITTTANWTQYRNLPIFDLRNGKLEDVASLSIEPTIETRFHWVPIADLDPVDAAAALDGLIRSHIHHLNINSGFNINRELNRKLAIVLGTIRAVSTTFYKLTEADLIADEVARPYLSARKNAEGTIMYKMVNDTTEATEDLTNPVVLTTTEQAAIAALVKSGLGAIPMQGHSLIMTGLHYLSDASSASRKFFNLVERAYWRGPAVGTWFQDHIVDIQNAAWYKSTHPVLMSFKQTMARDEELPKKLLTAQAGACAACLPAMEPELRAANSYLTCIRTVAPRIAMVGGSINYRVLEEAATAVACFPASGQVAPLADLSTVPTEVSSRGTALRHLSDVLIRAQPVAAYCYGFYRAMVDQNLNLNTHNEVMSLRGSYSLSKLVNQCHPNYVAGHEFYGDYVAARNAQRKAGSSVIE